eukprot:TRINITY_DN7302_c0_g5_i1.p1 TRINITY_DN7302_c0_g5~~TRINITY_DN7302_c0_g5_i1.p1  ORF type:complete len:321 (-),score=80.21 TRINITY_DN7302_c0_g5_i1:28-990(-)
MSHISTNTFRIPYRSRFQKFSELRTMYRKQNNNLNGDMMNDEHQSNKKSKKDKQKLLTVDLEKLDEMGGERPLWMGIIEEIKIDVVEIQSKMKTLNNLHAQHLKVQFEVDDEAENGIEILTGMITNLFQKSRKKVQIIGQNANLDGKEIKMRDNLKHALAKILQDLSTNFRESQESYLRELEMKMQKGKSSLDVDDDSPSSLNNVNYIDKGFNQEQMVWAQDNYDQIRERDKELRAVAKSITELASIFNDLAILVVDQGTILDRIDYNIEQAVVHVDKGVEELVKAEQNSRTSKIRSCMLLLCVLIVVMTILLILRLAVR